MAISDCVTFFSSELRIVWNYWGLGLGGGGFERMLPSVFFLTSSHLSAFDINRCSFPPIISFPQTISPTDAANHEEDHDDVEQSCCGLQTESNNLYYIIDNVKINIDKCLSPAVCKLELAKSPKLNLTANRVNFFSLLVSFHLIGRQKDYMSMPILCFAFYHWVSLNKDKRLSMCNHLSVSCQLTE